MSTKVFGIDLGTTYSAIAYINDQDAAEIVNNFEGNATTPSAIFFEGADNVVVGDEAKRGALADPDNSCLLIKREMGTDYSIEYQGNSYTPESLSALILRALVEAANTELGEEISKAVITVPAYFGTQEREATRQAGSIAGLEVAAIVTEPVAAALSIGVSSEKPETIMVYDLGGGTFDTTVMRVEPGKVEVVGIDGNRTLGGADWDEAMIGLLLEKFQEAAGEAADGCEFDEEFMLDLRLKAEETKKSLTRRQALNVRLAWQGHSEQVEITREAFESATSHLVDQTVEIAERTVAQAKEKHPGLEIDRVLLVGGSSRMPMIPEALKSKLGWDPVNTDFDLAVAKGAAIYGQAKVDEVLSDSDEELPDDPSRDRKYFLGGASSLSVSNVLARSLGIEFMDEDTNESYIGFFAHANDAIPFDPEPIRAQSVREGQTRINLSLYEQAGEQESEEVSDNRLLKEVDLPFERPMPKYSPVDIVITISAEGLVRLKAEDPESGNTVELEATVSQLSEAEVDAATSQVSALSLRS